LDHDYYASYFSASSSQRLKKRLKQFQYTTYDSRFVEHKACHNVHTLMKTESGNTPGSEKTVSVHTTESSQGVIAGRLVALKVV